MTPLLADAWLHNLDPYAIRLGWFPGGGLRWYGLSYLAGFAVAYLILRRVVGRGRSPMSAGQVMDYVVTVAIGIVIGGRLGYVLFYQPSLLLQFTGDLPYWGLLAINEGGMASHGGILGGVAGCGFYAWRQRYPFAHLLDLMAFSAPLGLLFGRLANFVNGELYGRACPKDFPLAVKFPQELFDGLSRPLADAPSPTQLEQISTAMTEQLQFSASIDYTFVEYILQKIQAGDAQVAAVVGPFLTPRYPSQLFAGLTEGLVVFAVLLWLYRRPVKPGLIGGAFCVSYAVMRVVNEFFRMPDAHLMTDGVLPAFTRGQWLSVGLFVLGAAILVAAPA